MLLRSRDAASVLLALRAGDGSRSAMEIHRVVLLARVFMELVSEF
jgi:hypothetical protein